MLYTCTTPFMADQRGGSPPLSVRAKTDPEPFRIRSGSVLEPFRTRSEPVPVSRTGPEPFPNGSKTVLHSQKRQKRGPTSNVFHDPLTALQLA